MVGHSNMLLDGARYACSGVRLRMHTLSTARRCMSLAAHLALDGISSLSTSDLSIWVWGPGSHLLVCSISRHLDVQELADGYELQCPPQYVQWRP